MSFGTPSTGTEIAGAQRTGTPTVATERLPEPVEFRRTLKEAHEGATEYMQVVQVVVAIDQ